LKKIGDGEVFLLRKIDISMLTFKIDIFDIEKILTSLFFIHDILQKDYKIYIFDI